MKNSRPFVVVLAQMPVISITCEEELQQNLDTVLRYIQMAATGSPHTDMVVFPEVCFQGSFPATLPLHLKMDDDTVSAVRQACKDYGIWGVFGGMFLDDSGKRENITFVVNDMGEIVARYSKMCPFLPYEGSAAGDEFCVFDGPHGARIALLVCSDSHDIDLWRCAKKSGANVVLHPSHWMDGQGDLWEISNRAGAYLSTCFVVAVNAVGSNSKYTMHGQSMVVNPLGRIIHEASCGVPSLTTFFLWPEEADYWRTQVDIGDLMWVSDNRGAASPAQNGIGLGPAQWKP